MKRYFATVLFLLFRNFIFLLLKVSNNEFVEDDLGILRGDMFFDILNKNSDKVS